MSFSKNTLLAVVLFLAIIAGITWYVQFMPGRGMTHPPPVDGQGGIAEVLRFKAYANQEGPLHAVWDLDENGNDARYVLESEKGTNGEYCFLFRNVLDRPAEIEMDKPPCDCTLADVCILPASEWQKIDAALTKNPLAKPVFDSAPQWQPCKKDDHVGIKVPAGGHGVLRIHWDVRKEPGNTLNLTAKFWSQPEGDVGNRQWTTIIVPVRVVPPLLFDPGRENVKLGPGDEATAVFHVWSATHDELDVSFGPREKDPLFKVTSRPLTPKERIDLQTDIRDRSKGAVDTRVKVGYLVKATVYETKDGQQMDQGPFQRPLPVYLDQLAVTFPTPEVIGYVRGPLEVIGGENDRGRVVFKLFSAAEPKTVVVPIYGDARFNLEVVESEPPFLKVELKKHGSKDTKAAQGRWDLKVTVPAKAWNGPLPEHSRVVLRIGSNPPRLVRIPVMGTATQ